MLSRSARLILNLIIFSAVGVCSSTTFALSNPTAKIEEAYSQGRISYGQRLLYEVMAVRAPEELPPDFRAVEKTPGKSATSILLSVRENIFRLSKVEQELLSHYLSRPNQDYSYDSPGGYFKIHYDLSGPHAVDSEDLEPANGVPDYVDWVAAYCDSARSCILGNLGYMAPPEDGNAGGDARYDCYILEMSYYGYTQPETPGPWEWDDWISYMAIHRNYLDFPPNDDPEGNEKGAAKVTCAHEYFHAVQLGYTLPADYWYMEVSSTWMEEICFPAVNDNYNYLDGFLGFPQLALNLPDDQHPYGAFIWNRFLDQYFDTALVRNIWEDLITSEDIYAIINSNLMDYGSSLYQAFAEFTLWNWCTYYNDDGQHYEDGWDYPLVVDLSALVTSYPTAILTPPLSKRPDGLGCNYIKLVNFGEVIGEIAISFDGQDFYHWKAALILASSGNAYTFVEIPLNEDRAGTLIINEIENYEYIILVPTVQSWYANDLNYNFSAELRPWPDYAVEVQGNGSGQVYSLGTRTVGFLAANRGARQDLYHMSVSDDLGWNLDLHDTLFAIPLKDTVLVLVDIQGGAGMVPGTLDNIYLTARSHSDSLVFSTGSLPVEIVRFNGDANNDGALNVSDAVWIINFVFVEGPEPVPELYQADANCDNSVNVSDAVYIINYVFVAGPPPPCLTY